MRPVVVGLLFCVFSVMLWGGTSLGQTVTAPNMRLPIASDRTRWQNSENADSLFVYHADDKVWREENQKGDSVFSFVERARTPDYVEIFDAGRDTTLRLYADKVLIRQGPDTWRDFMKGAWVTEQKAAIPSQPAGSPATVVLAAEAPAVPALSNIIQKAKNQLHRNRQAFDKANESVLMKLEKELQEELARFTRAGKFEEAMAAKQMIQSLKTTGLSPDTPVGDK